MTYARPMAAAAEELEHFTHSSCGTRPRLTRSSDRDLVSKRIAQRLRACTRRSTHRRAR